MCARAPRRLEDPQRKPPSIDALLVSRESSSHRVIVMRHFALSDPLLAAGGIIGTVSSSVVGHAEKQAFSDYQPVCPRQCQQHPHTTSPLPHGEGRQLHPPFHVKLWGSPILSVDAGLDGPQLSTMRTLVTACSAFQDPTPPLFRRCRGVRRPYLARDATSHVGSERPGNDSEERLFV